MRYKNQRISNEIIIDRVANGWIVRMPHRFDDEESAGSYGQSMVDGLKSMEPVLVDMFKKIKGDGEEWKDFMDKKEPEKDPHLDQKLMEAAQPVIGRDEDIYVCKDFQEVLTLLASHFSDEDEQ